MNRGPRFALGMAVAAALLAGCQCAEGQRGNGGSNGSQTGLPQSPTPGLSTAPTPGGPLDGSETGRDRMVRMEEEQARMRNSERQKKLIADTQRLVALANELKTDVDKTDKYTLSLDVIRKAEEIEKLAKSVKERMRN